MENMWRALEKVRNLLLRILNKQFLIFLFFLILSSVFWLIMTLNETYEKEMTIPLRLAGVPRKVVITDEPDSVVRFTVRDKGYMIAAYLADAPFRPLFFDFSVYSDGKGSGSISAADIQKQIYQQLSKSSKILSIKNDRVRFFYNYGLCKKVPVRLSGTVRPRKNYYLAGTRFYPDSVTVYASKSLLDSIHAVYTQRIDIENFTDRKVVNIGLRRITGAKLIPDKVRAEFVADVLIEESVLVPIDCINLPDDKVLRTFPGSVEVRFIVGTSILRRMPKTSDGKELSPAGFRLVVDYNEVLKRGGDKCHIALHALPAGVRSAKPATEWVDYLVEQR